MLVPAPSTEAVKVTSCAGLVPPKAVPGTVKVSLTAIATLPELVTVKEFSPTSPAAVVLTCT